MNHKSVLASLVRQIMTYPTLNKFINLQIRIQPYSILPAVDCYVFFAIDNIVALRQKSGTSAYIIAVFLCLPLASVGVPAQAQSASSLWACVEVGSGGKADGPSIPIIFKSPAWTVCFANETGQPITYRKAWGPDPLDTHWVAPGTLRAHWCDPAQATCIMPFQVWYDTWQTSPHRTEEIFGGPLNAYQQRAECMKCGLAAVYAFVNRGGQILLEQRR